MAGLSTEKDPGGRTGSNDQLNAVCQLAALLFYESRRTENICSLFTDRFFYAHGSVSIKSIVNS